MMFVLRAVFNMFVRDTRGPMCFRCLMFSLSGPCKSVFVICCIASGHELWRGDVISVYILPCSVNGSVCLACCVYDSVCQLFAETIRNTFERCYYFVVKCYGSV